MRKSLIVILGPTGVGKTDVCLRVAEFFHIPIINADSRQIFQEIPIGTAAPTPQQQQRVKHYMVANHQLSDYYSASMYEQDVLKILDDIPDDGFLIMGWYQHEKTGLGIMILIVLRLPGETEESQDQLIDELKQQPAAHDGRCRFQNRSQGNHERSPPILCVQDASNVIKPQIMRFVKLRSYFPA